MATNTPWGLSQQTYKVAVGIRDYSTASHGGFHLSPRKNAMIPDYMRQTDGWYEEDCAWAIPAMIFRKEFIEYFMRNNSNKCSSECDEIIIKTFRAWYPEQYERFFNVTLQPNESYMKDHP